MSPYKRPGSPFWQVAPRVPGYGRVGPWSTVTKDKRQAEQMEKMLRDLPLRGYGDLIQLITTQRTTLPDVYVAHLEDRLHDIRLIVSDPKLADCIGSEEDEASFLNQMKDARVRNGLLELLKLAPTGARLSFIRDSKNVESVLHARERQGLKRNSVRRSLYRAISDLLDRETGSAGRAAVMSEVKYPAAKDERDAKLRPEQIAKLLDKCTEPLFECFVGLAVTSGIDRGPMLRIRPRYFNEVTSELDVLDTKTAARPRTLVLPNAAATFLRRAIQMSHPGMDGLVFPWTVNQIRDRWNAAREDAGLEWLRLKDLRSVFADAFVEAGGTLKDLQAVLGHSSGKTSMRYTRAQPVRQQDTMEGAARVMGFGPRHLKLQEGSA